jgi:hypothetical protein
MAGFYENEGDAGNTHGAAASASAAEAKGWAREPEDVLVPDGNLVDEYSALHYSKKAEASSGGAQVIADTAQVSADASAASANSAAASDANAAASASSASTNLGLTNADVAQTTLDAAATAADLVLTSADVVSTNADVVVTNADVAQTTLDAAATAADLLLTDADTVATAADAASASGSAANALVSETNSALSETAAALSASSAATVTSRNSVQNQDPVSQGTAARAGVSSTIYTGNGTTQAVSTGIDMATGDFGGLVWIKNRTGAVSNRLIDTVRGTSISLRFDTTGTETLESTGVTGITATGFNVGTNGDYNFNTHNLVAWSWQTTEKTTGLTNRNKAYTTHYNADIGFSITGLIGDGVDGHEIPHYLGKEPELVIWKDRDAVGGWIVQSNLLGQGDYLAINATAAVANAPDLVTVFSPTTLALDNSPAYNADTHNIIQYAFTSIPNVCEINTHIGTGAAGNYVDCGFGTKKAAWVMMKNLTAASNWVIIDGSRGEGYLLADNSNAEVVTDFVDFVSGGFVTKGASINTLNNQYIFMAYAESTAFDGGKTLTNYDYATTDEVLTINAGTLMSFAEGFNANGQVDTQELVGAGVTLSFGAGFEDQTRYVYKDKAGTYGSTEYRNLEGISRAQADKFGVVPPLDAATRTTDKHFGYESATGVVLASGEFTGNPAWQAFNKDSNNILGADAFWRVASVTTSFLQYKFSEPRVLKSWRMRETDSSGRLPRLFDIEGSNDGLNWTVIDGAYNASSYVGNGVSLWGDIQDTSAKTTAYVYHRINTTANDGDATYTAIAELEFNTITPSDYYNVVDGQVYGYLGDELVTNGTFDTDTSGWVARTATLTSISGELEINGSAAYGAATTTGIPVIFGKLYRLEAEGRIGTSDNWIATIAGAVSSAQIIGTNSGSNEALAVEFIAGGSFVNIELATGSTIGTSFFNNVSIKQLDPAIARDYLAKVMTGASGEILNFENLPVAKIKGVDAELQGKLTVHGDISNRGVCTAWAVVNETTNPPTIIDSHNIKGVIDIGGTSIKYIVEDGIDVRSASLPNSVEVASVTPNSFTITSSGIARRSVAIFGGKDIL